MCLQTDGQASKKRREEADRHQDSDGASLGEDSEVRGAGYSAHLHPAWDFPLVQHRRYWACPRVALCQLLMNVALVSLWVAG